MSTTNTALLVDGDALAYRVAAANEVETEWAPGEITLSSSLNAAKTQIDGYLRIWADKWKAKTVRVAMSDTPWTFRMDVYKPYKAHRADKRKPLGLAQLRQHLMDHHGGTVLPGLEADDLMGLWMTDKYKDGGIIVSWDKDMRAVPGRFWVPGTETFEERDEEEANLMWMAQTLSGDQADGYPGCRTVGIVRAERIVKEAEEKAWRNAPKAGDLRVVPPMLPVLWERVLKEFLKKGHTEEDAIVSARLARILRHGDYDLKEKKVRLWTPPSLSSSASTPTPHAPVKARAHARSRPKRSLPVIPWISCRSRSRSAVPRVGSSRRRGPTRKSAHI